MLPLLRSAAVAGLALAASASAQLAAFDTALIGTWSTKSNKTITGPGFYDPVNERLIEPSHTGFSYSFTGDGFYEEAYYRAIANPITPSCPSGIMQWQHGTYQKFVNGSLILTPFAVDGRQLLSTPCHYKDSIYTRYNQSELMKSYEVLTDPYHNTPRLNLYQFDGKPLAPMYLVYSPPEMLPTSTLNPTHTAGATATGKPSGKFRRGLGEEITLPLNHKLLSKRKETINADRWWWIGAGMTGLGGVLYFCF
ncbi:chaperone for protein-folding within the ER, fungal-domain-containing protein [Cryomyces antarcticus]